MSYILGKNKLQIGYWLAKKIIFEDKKIQKKEMENYYTYSMFIGKILMYKNFIFYILKKENFYISLKREIIFLKNKKIKTSIFYLLKIIYNKLFRLIVQR